MSRPPPSKPKPPEKPLPSDCCETGCDVCIYDVYAQACEDYRCALAEWQKDHGAVTARDDEAER